MTDFVPLASPEEVAELSAEECTQILGDIFWEYKVWLASPERLNEPVALFAFHSWLSQLIPLIQRRSPTQLVRPEIPNASVVDLFELMRRVDRRIAASIRAGQASGELMTQNDTPLTAPDKLSVLSFGKDYGTLSNMYRLFDSYPDYVFEEAIRACRDTPKPSVMSLGRPSLIKKMDEIKNRGLDPAQKLARIKEMAKGGMTSDQIAKGMGVRADYVRLQAKKMGVDIPADKVMRGTRRTSSVDLAERATSDLSALIVGIRLIDYDDLSPDKASELNEVLAPTMRELSRFATKIKEMSQ